MNSFRNDLLQNKDRFVLIIQPQSSVMGTLVSSGGYFAQLLCDHVGGGQRVGGGVRGQGLGQHFGSGAIRNTQWRLFTTFYTNNKCGSV